MKILVPIDGSSYSENSLLPVPRCSERTRESNFSSSSLRFPLVRRAS